MMNASSCLRLLVAVGLVAVSSIPTDAQADVVGWSTVLSACEERLTTGTDDNLTSVHTLAEGGMRMTIGSSGLRYLTCPVILDHNGQVDEIQLRAYDNFTGANDFVFVGFYRQPWTEPGGDAELIGYLYSDNNANLPHVSTAFFAPQMIDNRNYTYFVRAVLNRATTADIRGYQVRIKSSLGLAADASTADPGIPGNAPVPEEPIVCQEVLAKPEWAITDLERIACLLEE